MVNVFAVPVFFICFRECLESSIIVSILLSFLKQTLGPDRDPAVYKRLVRQVWLGVGLGLLICIIVGAGMIGAFYGLQSAAFSKTENIWEGVFALLASIIISLMGAALLRVSKLQDKWRVKIARAIEAKDSSEKLSQNRLKTWAEKYAMFVLPFVTVLREGLEAVVFIGGVGVGLPAESFPLAVLCGLGAGALIGFLMYKGANATSMQIFLIISTCFLYLVAAGLFSRGVWSLENNTWNNVVGGDASETGAGPGSYDIRQSVWHINCCSPQVNGGGGWGVFSSLFGWQNSATYGSVISYNLYWLIIIVFFISMRYQEKNGHWPFMKSNQAKRAASKSSSQGAEANSDHEIENEKVQAAPVSSKVREVSS